MSGVSGSDLKACLQAGEGLAENAGPIEDGMAADALELPAIVMAVAPDDAIDIADLHAGLKHLLAQVRSAVPPDFHRLAGHGRLFQNQRGLHLKRSADLQRLQSPPQRRVQGP